MTESTLIRYLVITCKALVGVTYLSFIVLVLPKIDIAARLPKVKLVRVVLSVFFSMSIITYAHIIYFIYKNFMPEGYWNSPWYLVFVFTHAVFGISSTILIVNLISPRIVDRKAYSDMIDRAAEKEMQAILSESDKEVIEELERQSRSTNDMAKLLLKAYKN